MLFDGLKGGVADYVLDAAGVLGGCCFVNAKGYQHAGKHRVPLVQLLGNCGGIR